MRVGDRRRARQRRRLFRRRQPPKVSLSIRPPFPRGVRKGITPSIRFPFPLGKGLEVRRFVIALPRRLRHQMARWEGEITLLNVKPAVGFTLPSAGVTPAPSEKKSRNVEDNLSLSGSGEEGAGKLPRPLLYGRGGRRAQPPVGEGSAIRAESVQFVPSVQKDRCAISETGTGFACAKLSGGQQPLAEASGRQGQSPDCG